MRAPSVTTPSNSHVPPARHKGAPRRIGGPRRLWDWVFTADPGLGHLQAGWRSLVSMVVGFAGGYEMASVLHIPTMLGLMIGGTLGLISTIVITDNTPPLLARSMLWMPIPFSAATSVSVWLHPHRVLEMWLAVASMALLLFLVRFGPLGLVTGVMTFAPFLIGLTTNIPLDDCGKLAVVSLVTAVALLMARLILCCPTPREDLLRTQRAFVIEARRVADAAATALDPEADQAVAVKRMRRALHRLNVTTLTIDGRLAQPEVAADPHMAELLHRHLFDAEVALQGIGRTVPDLNSRHVPPALREAVVDGLIIARNASLGEVNALRPAVELIRRQAGNAPAGMSPAEVEVRALVRRVADLLDALADSLTRWFNLGRIAPTTKPEVLFQSSVVLEPGSVLAGSGPAAKRLADGRHGQGWRRAIPACLRGPLHIAIPAAITLPFADAFSGRHFYWGLIGVLIALMGTNTVPERLRKLGHRVAGTAIGAVIGLALLHFIGPGHGYWTLLILVAGISIGSWGMRRRYIYFVVGLVAGLVQLYGLTTPYGHPLDWLLTQRLIDNAFGMTVATVCAALLFPVSTRDIVSEAEHGYLSALEQLISQIAERWDNPETPVRLRSAARGVNAAQYQLHSVLRPLIRMPIGRRRRRGENLLALFGATTGHAQALAVAADTEFAPQLRRRIGQITEILINSLHSLDRQVTTGECDGVWVRLGPVIRELRYATHGSAELPAGSLDRALDELAAMDELLAGLADERGLNVTAFPSDPEPAGFTTPPQRQPAGDGEHGAGGVLVS